MEEITYKKVKVAGTLIIPGTGISFYLLMPYPVRKSDDWMRDDMATFYVANEGGKSRHIVVRGSFVMDYLTAGREIAVIDQDAAYDIEFESLVTAEVDAD